MLAYVARHFNALAPLLRRQIRLRYGFDLAAHAYNGARAEYRRMLAAFPSIGEDNPLADVAYAVLVILALYRNAEGELAPEMLRVVLTDIFGTSPLRTVSRITCDLNRASDMRRLSESVAGASRWTSEHPLAEPYTWGIRLEGTTSDAHLSFHITRCPVYDFCLKQDMLEVLPVICDIGHMGCSLLHGRLTREQMMPRGDATCHYRIEGDRVPVREG